MKKMISALLALVLCLSLCACGANNEPTAPLSAKEQLTEKELSLFDALIKMTTKDFYEPAAIRILEVGDYEENMAWEEDSYIYGPDTVVVRLQGENRMGGTLNHYYLVCITAAENMTKTAQSTLEAWTLLGKMEQILKHKGEVGDYAELSDGYQLEASADETFNIGRINKALAEYWEEMGF